MKKEYEKAQIEFLLLDQQDVITTSINGSEGPIGGGPIGGGGYDPDGWT